MKSYWVTYTVIHPARGLRLAGMGVTREKPISDVSAIGEIANAILQTLVRDGSIQINDGSKVDVLTWTPFEEVLIVRLQ